MSLKFLLPRAPLIRNLCTTTFSRGTAFGWLASLLALHLVLPHKGVLAEIEVECFDCSWQSSLSLQNLEKGQEFEFCLPEHFQRDKVKTVSCSQGCMITSMYENDPDGPVTTLELRSTSSSGGGGSGDTTTPASAITPQHQNRPPMSFFTRGCPNGDSTRKGSGCEEKSYQNVFREECFCTTPLCNGSGARVLVGASGGLSTLIFVFLLNLL